MKTSIQSPLVLSYSLVMQKLYFSQFFTRFFVGLSNICSRANVRNRNYRHLFIAIVSFHMTSQK